MKIDWKRLVIGMGIAAACGALSYLTDDKSPLAHTLIGSVLAPLAILLTSYLQSWGNGAAINAMVRAARKNAITPAVATAAVINMLVMLGWLAVTACTPSQLQAVETDIPDLGKCVADGITIVDAKKYGDAGPDGSSKFLVHYMKDANAE